MLRTVLALFLQHQPEVSCKQSPRLLLQHVLRQASSSSRPSDTATETCHAGGPRHAASRASEFSSDGAALVRTSCHPSWAPSRQCNHRHYHHHFHENRHIHSTPSSSMCRWVQEEDREAAGGHDDQQPKSNKTSTSDAAEKGIDVRMESQVVFDACWRRFEDKYKLKVC